MNCSRLELALCVAIVCVGCGDSGEAGAPVAQGGSGEAGFRQGGSGEAGSAGGVAGQAAGSSGGGVAGTAGTAGTGNVDAGVVDAAVQGESALIHYYGRWNRAVAGRAITVNTGSHVEATFEGTGLVARFDTALNEAGGRPTLAWRIDGGAWSEAEIAASVMLATGVTSGKHEVLLMVRGLDENRSRWRPPLVSSVTFLGLDVTGGILLTTARPNRKKLEFLGDSITEGVLVQPSRPGKSTSAWRTDGRTAYASQTAMLLGADWRQVGFGAQGLTRGGNGGVPAAGSAFNFIYDNVPRDRWQADLVIINQGTNDRGEAAEVVQQAMAQYLVLVRAAYPAAHIAVLRPFVGVFATGFRAAVQARIDGGDARVSFIDTGGWLVASDYTDGVHPNVQGSGKIRDRLAPILMKLL
jgi:lysophospholipase L1-like esterase